MATLLPRVEPLSGALMLTMGAAVSVATGAGAWVALLNVKEAGLLLPAASRAMT